MQYQSDYVLRLIEQMGSLLRRALEQHRTGGSAETLDLAEQAIGLALDMDPLLAGRLAPQTIMAMVELKNLDDRVIVMLADALELQADALIGDGELMAASVRREQAAAVRSLLDPGRAN